MRRAGTTGGGRQGGAEDTPASPGSSDLTIRPAADKPLSKDERAFNRLTARIGELERDIAAERAKLESFLDRYNEKVLPLEQALARRQVELARALADAAERLALRNKQKDALREMLVDLCREAFDVEKPDAGTEAFYDEWSEVRYREELRREADDLKHELADDLRSRFGIDVDVPEGTSPEAMARFFHELKQRERAAAQSSPEENTKRAGRAARRGRGAATARSLREIYLSLAKVLHPDVVAGDEGKLREESMKRAITAYRDFDVTALLDLELRWLARDSARGALPDDALRRYIPALRQQAARLEQSLEEESRDPRYGAIHFVAFMDERWGLAELKKHAQELREATESVEQMLRYVKRCEAKTELLRLVAEYREGMRREIGDRH
ncbi:MAG TPA: hypothetical protein VN634_11225 [Candidatus Limnocylindrales bacterium]|nr:hypothetical protein [Candidatus Limnocylindrales bacterium]